MLVDETTEGRRLAFTRGWRMSYGRIIAADRNNLVQQSRNLMGIALGLIADAELNDREIRFLKDWLDLNQNITYEWPGDVLYRRVSEVLADGVITEQERAHLLETLRQICGGGLDQPTPVNQLAFDENAAIRFPGANFCVTGDFVFGPRDRVEATISDRGGVVQKRVTKQLHYLVVGLQGSDEWKHGSFGSKILKAVEYKRGCSSGSAFASSLTVSFQASLARR